jgi:transposase InsO family protein
MQKKKRKQYTAEFKAKVGKRDAQRRKDGGAIGSRKPRRRFVIAKRRSQFTSPQYTQLLLSHDVRISMDSKGRAFDNIFTERFCQVREIKKLGSS